MELPTAPGSGNPQFSAQPPERQIHNTQAQLRACWAWAERGAQISAAALALAPVGRRSCGSDHNAPGVPAAPYFCPAHDARRDLPCLPRLASPLRLRRPSLPRAPVYVLLRPSRH